MKHTQHLPEIGFVRLKQLLPPFGPIPMSASQVWALVAAGRFPAPVKLSARVTAWDVISIRRYIAEKQAHGGGHA